MLGPAPPRAQVLPDRQLPGTTVLTGNYVHIPVAVHIRRVHGVGGVLLCQQVALPAAMVPAAGVVYQTTQYQKQRFRMLGVLSINGSPSCGVNLTYYEGEGPGTGAYMEELQDALSQAWIGIRVKGVQDAKPDEAVAMIAKLDS